MCCSTNKYNKNIFITTQSILTIYFSYDKVLHKKVIMKGKYMRASDIAYKAIMDKLLLGEFKSGETIEEKKLLEVLKTSKTPLREALVRLTQEGYVVNPSHRGMSFVNLSISDMHSLLNLRVALMPYLASRLVAQVTDEQIDFLEYLINSEKGDAFIFDHKMHCTLNSFSNDRYLIDTLDRLEKLSIIAFRYLFLFQHHDISSQDIYKQNLHLVNTLRRRNVEELTIALKKHIPQYIIQYNY